MLALCWFGKEDVRVESVADPRLLLPTDAIVRVTRTAICGSDLHLFDGFIPGMAAGDILGHEFTGEVVETGAGVRNLQRGDRVVVPFAISCGQCYFCRRELWALCDNSNPNAGLSSRLYGAGAGALFGYSHLMGGYAGGQAQFVRVPYADVGPMKIPDEISDEQALLLSDVFPTGYMAAENCDLEPGDTVALWGCGPVGQFAIRSAFMLGAAKVIAIDRIPERLRLAAAGGAEPLNYSAVDDLQEELLWRTGGRGADACIDAVGLEAHGWTLGALYDRAKTSLRLESRQLGDAMSKCGRPLPGSEAQPQPDQRRGPQAARGLGWQREGGSSMRWLCHTDRAHVLRQAIQACRKGGTLSIPGVYGGLLDSVPFGAAFAKGLTLRMGQTHVHRYLRPLLQRIQQGEIDPTFLISHRLPLAEAPRAYRLFRDKQQACIKVVLDPWQKAA